MKKGTVLAMVLAMAFAITPAIAMEDHSKMGSDMKDSMSESGMDTFKHQASNDGVDAEFQVMSLASMNMKSKKGETHHIMVNLSKTDGGDKIKKAIGKIKVIGPDGSEQISSLENYSGILAANFNFEKPGKYGVICLLKNNEKKHQFKFWYEHM